MKKRILALCMTLLLLISNASALTVEEARRLVERLYINEVPEEALQSATVEELFAGLDRYSSYFTPEEYRAFLDTMNDVSIVGLGVVSSLSEDGSYMEVSKVLSGGAAQAAGMTAGDRILAVDGRPVAEAASLEEAGSWLKGEEGSRVTLTLLRPDGREEELTLTRAVFTLPYTEYKLVEGHIGYIDCVSFGEETYGHFTAALEELGEQVDSWVLDLRNNSGGLAVEAARVAGIFTGAGNKAMLRDRSGRYYSFPADGAQTTLYPVIVLVGENTASAAELLAAAIRDGQGGLILGGRTFGKGVAQTLVDRTVEPKLFADGDAVRITSARFYSSAGLTNDQMGVLPHLMVADEAAADIAYLLCEPAPGIENRDFLRLHVGGWQWHLSLEKALEGEGGAYRAAFVELLEALWPEADIFRGDGNGGWEGANAAELAADLGLEEYRSRTFADGKDSPYQYAMDVLGTYGILRGDEGANIDPEGVLTRAQLCALLAQTLNRESGNRRFADVPEEAWYAGAVGAMAELGFVQGDGAGNFHPEEVLTQEQLLTVLARVAAWMSAEFYELEQAGPQEGALEDKALAQYSGWAKQSAWLLGRSQVNLFGDYISYVWKPVEDIDPQAPATREITAHSLVRIMDLIGILRQ